MMKRWLYDFSYGESDYSCQKIWVLFVLLVYEYLDYLGITSRLRKTSVFLGKLFMNLSLTYWILNTSSQTYLWEKTYRNSNLTKFSQQVIDCLAEWGKKSAECKGELNCLQACSSELRSCLDGAFPDAEKIEFETDKINYILSSVFFLINRISKASIGLAELDRAVTEVQKTDNISLGDKQNKEEYHKLKQRVDEIIANYFWHMRSQKRDTCY